MGNQIKVHFQTYTHLREAADEGVVSAGAVLRVQVVVEEDSVAGVHQVPADVELRLDAAPQVVTAAGELSQTDRQWADWGHLPRANADFSKKSLHIAYNVNESGQEDDDDGEDAHQGAVESGLDDTFGKSLQRSGEDLVGKNIELINYSASDLGLRLPII